MANNKTFKDFLKSNWWFLLLGFSKALINSDKSQMTNSKFLDTLIFVGVIFILMLLWWTIKYKIFFRK